VGYLSASIRTVADARVGGTITHHFRKADNSLPGYEEATPMVFCGLFPVDADQYGFLFCISFSLLNKRIVLLLVNVAGVNLLFFVLSPDLLSYEMHLRSFNSMMLH
jgi:GTP-binding protein LepA